MRSITKLGISRTRDKLLSLILPTMLSHRGKAT